MKNFSTFLFVAALLLLSQISFNSFAQDSIFDTSSSSLFSNEDEFLKPEDAFVFNFDQKNNLVNVSFDIAQGYYLYKKQFKFTSVNSELGNVILPVGIDHEDEFFGLQQIYTDRLTFDVPLTSVNQDGELSIRYQGCAEKGLCFPPITKTINLSQITAGPANVLTAITKSPESPQSKPLKSEESEQHQLADMLKSDNIWLTLVAFFVGGLLLSFTPCVFPMYPILTGIIVGQKEKLSTKKAFSLSFFYVQGMAITYTLLGIVVALAGAKFQAMFQHPYVLIALSALFIFLALSMFGFFNLALPSSWQNKLNNISNNQKGGSYFGVLAMGAISGLVASPCTTAPLTGALLYISQSGDIALGASALYALSLGMGLPLLILGSSGGKLLPKAGNWMNVIKNIFGLLLLVVPVFLLERFLPEHITAVLWLVWLLITGYYFMSVIQSGKATIKRHLLSLVILVSVVIGVIQVFSHYPVHSNSNSQHDIFIKVDSLQSLQETVKRANAEGKTVMVDLYADWCIACKEFEQYTFPEPEVQKALKNSLLVQIDLTDMGNKNNSEFMKHFDIFGLPSILFFDLNGKELTKKRVTGFMAADQFAAHINAIF
ncbi:protein-disulfide reductase DsbD [Colwelliaceae bacterium 6441]